MSLQQNLNQEEIEKYINEIDKDYWNIHEALMIAIKKLKESNCDYLDIISIAGLNQE